MKTRLIAVALLTTLLACTEQSQIMGLPEGEQSTNTQQTDPLSDATPGEQEPPAADDVVTLQTPEVFAWYGVKSGWRVWPLETSNRPERPVPTDFLRVSLQWQAIPGAAGYDVFENGEYIGNASNTAFDRELYLRDNRVDLSFSSFEVEYRIRAFSAEGNVSELSEPAVPVLSDLF